MCSSSGCFAYLCLSACMCACVFTCAQIRHGVNRGGHGRFDGPSSEVCWLFVFVLFFIPFKPAVKSAALLNLKSYFQIDTLPLHPSSSCPLSSLCHLFEQSETIRAHNSESRVRVSACSVVVLFPPPFFFLVISLRTALFHTITQHGSSGRLHFGTLGYSNTPPVCLVSVSPE